SARIRLASPSMRHLPWPMATSLFAASEIFIALVGKTAYRDQSCKAQLNSLRSQRLGVLCVSLGDSHIHSTNLQDVSISLLSWFGGSKGNAENAETQSTLSCQRSFDRIC